MGLDTDFSAFTLGDIPLLENPGDVVSDPNLDNIQSSTGILSSIKDDVNNYIDKFYPSSSNQTQTLAPTGSANTVQINSNGKSGYIFIAIILGLIYYLHSKKVV